MFLNDHLTEKHFKNKLPNRIKKIFTKILDITTKIEHIDHKEKKHPSNKERKKRLRSKYFSLIKEASTLVRSKHDRLSLITRSKILSILSKDPAEDCQKGIISKFKKKWASISEENIIFFCGYLQGWYTDDKKYNFSSFIAIVDLKLEKTVNTLDHKINKLITYIQNRYYLNVSIAKPPLFKISYLVATAGKADTHPRHFTYFFPENENVKFSSHKKTCLFVNQYFHLHNSFNSKLDKNIIDLDSEQEKTVITMNDIKMVLIIWFKGHDIAHGIRSHEIDFLSLRKSVGYTNSMALQELMADVFGYLFLIDNAWTTSFTLTYSDKINTVFVKELFRYISRGLDLNPDSLAAAILVIYLIKNNCIFLSSSNDCIYICGKTLKLRMSDLIFTITKPILQNDMKSVNNFLNYYHPTKNINIIDTIKCFLGESFEINN